MPHPPTRKGRPTETTPRPGQDKAPGKSENGASKGGLLRGGFVERSAPRRANGPAPFPRRRPLRNLGGPPLRNLGGPNQIRHTPRRGGALPSERHALRPSHARGHERAAASPRPTNVLPRVRWTTPPHKVRRKRLLLHYQRPQLAPSPRHQCMRTQPVRSPGPVWHHPAPLQANPRCTFTPPRWQQGPYRDEERSGA